MHKLRETPKIPAWNVFGVSLPADVHSVQAPDTVAANPPTNTYFGGMNHVDKDKSAINDNSLHANGCARPQKE